MTWQNLIQLESSKPYFQSLQDFLSKEREQYTIYPPKEDVWNAFKLTPLEQVKVVILGQDPYHGPNQAHGLSFSVLPKQPIPPSLKNIFKEINNDFQSSHQFPHGCLTSWAEQGVLLLNTALTVRAGSPNSHQNKGWEIFTDEVIKTLNNQTNPLVFLLWGANARAKKKLISNHLVLESGHPSPFSCQLFFNNKHFSTANNFLIEHQLSPINWFF